MWVIVELDWLDVTRVHGMFNTKTGAVAWAIKHLPGTWQVKEVSQTLERND